MRASDLELAQRQKLLYDVLEAANRPREAAEIAVQVAEAILRHTGWTGVVVALPGDDGCWVLPGFVVPPGFRAPVSDGVLGRAFSTGRTQLVPDVSLDPDYVAAQERTRSELAVPVRTGGRTLGVLDIESDRLDAFSPETVRLAEAVAEPIALGLENARLYQAIASQTARLEAVVHSSRDGLVLVGPDGQVLLLSESARLLLALDGERAVGERAERLWEEIPPGLRDDLEVATARDEAADGESAVGGGVVRWASYPVVGVGRLFVFRDVTHERALERMREDLTRTMVHDLRNPLTAILGSVELVGLSPDLRPRQRELLDIAVANVQRQLRLIDAILDVSRLEAGSVPLERGPVDLAPLVAEVCRLAGPRASARGLALLSEVPVGLPAVMVDGELIARVLDNLIGNAIKFTPAGGTVRVCADATAGFLDVAVRDDGGGVPAEMLPRLFQKFAAGTQEGRGSGLGLAFCRLVVETHGGRIWLGEGPGAAFHFTLPVA